MNSTKSNTSNTHQPKRVSQHANFIEALKSIGSSTVKSVKDDVLKGTGTDLLNQTVSPTNQSPFPESQFSPDMFQPDWFREQGPDIESEVARRQRHSELNLTPLFDRREEEIKAQIKSLREELAALAKDLGNLGRTVQVAIDEEISHPGTYHVNYFEKLKKFILNLRKQVNQSASWLEVSYARKASKKHYWGGVQKGGTKFMLSHDRSVATQTG
jgi:hypothetical protein